MAIAYDRLNAPVSNRATQKRHHRGERTCAWITDSEWINYTTQRWQKTVKNPKATEYCHCQIIIANLPLKRETTHFAPKEYLATVSFAPAVSNTLLAPPSTVFLMPYHLVDTEDRPGLPSLFIELIPVAMVYRKSKLTVCSCVFNYRVGTPPESSPASFTSPQPDWHLLFPIMTRGFIPIPARDQMTQDSRRIGQSCEKARVGVGQDIRDLRPQTAELGLRFMSTRWGGRQHRLCAIQ